MRQLDSLRTALRLVGSMRDFALETRQFQWQAGAPNTFFLSAQQADIRLASHESERILATIRLQAGFGWQLSTDQDAAGVYIIARRKALVSGIARARFDIKLPRGLHVSLKLERCRLCLDNLDLDLEFLPFA